MRVALLSAFVALAALLAGCTGSGAVCKDYEPPASFDAQNPKVSFATDVIPIFAASCAFTSCHGATSGPANGVYLGQDQARTYAAIVDVRSSKLPSMAFVTPGNARESFLMRKMDGSQCVLDAMCTNGSCGDAMPRGEDALSVEMRDVIRRWIAQGAAR